MKLLNCCCLNFNDTARAFIVFDPVDTHMALLTDLPDELLLEIIFNAYSIHEIRALGLVCRRLYDILLAFRYHELCRCLHMLSSDSMSSVAFTQRLASSSEATWATSLISQSIADELYSDEWPFCIGKPKPPGKNPSIIEGCGDNLAKEILTSHLEDRGDRDVRRRLKRLSKLITRGDWDDRVTEIAECAALRLTRNYQAETGYYTLSTLYECHRKHGISYDLTSTRDSMYMALQHDGVNPIKHYWRAQLRGFNLT